MFAQKQAFHKSDTYINLLIFFLQFSDAHLKVIESQIKTQYSIRIVFCEKSTPRYIILKA